MIQSRNKSALVIRNSNLDIVWDLVLGCWRFYRSQTLVAIFSTIFTRDSSHLPGSPDVHVAEAQPCPVTSLSPSPGNGLCQPRSPPMI
jgi:hypothetical protein